MPDVLKVFVSHAHDERALAGAWKNLLESISAGVIQVWFSSDLNAEGGMVAGTSWYTQLVQRVADSQYVLAIQTRVSTDRPWILWECGVASGIVKERGIVPVLYGVEPSGMNSPLAYYQVFKGDDKADVRRLSEQLAASAGLTVKDSALNTELNTYFSAVSVSLGYVSKVEEVASPTDSTHLRNMFEHLARSGRKGDINTAREKLYSSVTRESTQLDAGVHDVLSRLLMEHGEYEKSIEETDRCATSGERDIENLYRRCSALARLDRLKAAEDLISQIYSIDNSLRKNPQMGTLEATIHSAKWAENRDAKDLEKAVLALRRSHDQEHQDYETGLKLAQLALENGDAESAEKTLIDVLATCKIQQQKPRPAPSVDFAAGQAYLGLGNSQAAMEEFQRGLTRAPGPSIDERRIAIGRAYKMAALKQLPLDVIVSIANLLV